MLQQCPGCDQWTVEFDTYFQRFRCYAGDCRWWPETKLEAETQVEMKSLNHWTDLDYLRRAYTYARDHSDDPSTQNGAVLIPTNGLVSYGANHFAHGVKVTTDRLLDRDEKLLFMEHAERDAIFKSGLLGYATYGATLYVPWFACADCARAIIAAGIVRVVGHKQMMDKTPKDWLPTIEVGNVMLDEAGVKREYLDVDLFDSDPQYAVLFRGQLWIP